MQQFTFRIHFIQLFLTLIGFEQKMNRKTPTEMRDKTTDLSRVLSEKSWMNMEH